MKFFKEKRDVGDALETEKPRNQILYIPEEKGTEKLENKKANFEKPEVNKKKAEADGDTTKGQRERAVYNAEEKLPEKSNHEKLNKNMQKEKEKPASSNAFKEGLRVDVPNKNYTENKQEKGIDKREPENNAKKAKHIEGEGR